jgi:hypothetical protein
VSWKTVCARTALRSEPGFERSYIRVPFRSSTKIQSLILSLCSVGGSVRQAPIRGAQRPRPWVLNAFGRAAYCQLCGEVGTRSVPALDRRRQLQVTFSLAPQQARIWTSYFFAISGSREISVNASALACATGILSKGSRWCIGRVR